MIGLWVLAIWMGLGVAMGEIMRRDRPDDFDALAAIFAMLFGPLFMLGLLGLGVVIVGGELAVFVALRVVRAGLWVLETGWSIRTRWRLWWRRRLLARELHAMRFAPPALLAVYRKRRSAELAWEACAPEHAFLDRWFARLGAAPSTKPIAGTERRERSTP